MINYEVLAPLVKRVANSVHSNYPPHHSREDTESALWVWLLEKKNTVADLVGKSESWERALNHMMTGVATNFLNKEDAAAYGYSQEDVFVYSTDLVKTLLESVFDHEDWQSFSAIGDGQPRAKAQANQAGDRTAMLADVSIGLQKLNDDQYNILVWAYKYGYTPARLGEELGITGKAASERIRRAVQALRKQLGVATHEDLRRGYSGRSGRVGTAQALAQVERDYEG